MSKTLADFIEEETQALKIDAGGLKDLSALAKEALQSEEEITNLEKVLSDKKKEHRNLVENRIPSAMQEIGMSNFTMADGSMIEVKPFYSASIPTDRKGEAFEWLRQHGYDDIIKNLVSVQFGRGEDDDASKLIGMIRENGMISSQTEKIESQTLRAWVREMVEQGVNFPTELFGAFCGTKANIKSSKK
jgi:hypothetical protein